MSHIHPQGFTRSVDPSGLFGLSFVTTGSKPLFPGTTVTMSAKSDAHQRAVQDAVMHHNGYLAVLRSAPDVDLHDTYEDVATLVLVTDCSRRGDRLSFRCEAVGRLHVMRAYGQDRLDAAPMPAQRGCAQDTMHVLRHMLPSLASLSQELYDDISRLVREQLPCGELADQLTALTCIDRAVAIAQLRELDEQRRLSRAMDGFLRLVATLKHHLDSQNSSSALSA